MTTKLLDETHRLLMASDLTLKEIAAGADVGYHWLTKFSQQVYPDPGVLKVEKLHCHLSMLAARKANG